LDVGCLRPTLIATDAQPSFHYDNDRKLEEQIQGYGAVNSLILTVKSKMNSRFSRAAKLRKKY
jgi:uncharacterized protein YggE